jgi:hypothetical protein
MKLPSSTQATSLIISLLLLSIAAMSCFALWARATAVPIDRLLKNINAHIARNPKDAQAYYVCGRLHSLAFATGTRQLEVYESGADKLPQIPSYESIFAKRTGKFQFNKEAQAHLLASIQDYQRATELDRNNAMAFLGLGWVLEDGSMFADKVNAFPKEKKPKNPQGLWQAKALTAYRRAYELTVKSDLKLDGLGPGAHTAISAEAGESILRLLRNRTLTNAERTEIANIEKTIAEIEKKPRAITPIIFPLDKSAPLESLLAPDQRIRFDLAGDGKAALWPWVKPNVGILVWDPKHTGRITSGQQLFGSVTWWIAWTNGYQPLALLDNNGDGWLTGKELRGLAIWVDTNGNGISDSGEVSALEKVGVARLATSGMETRANTPFHPQGIQFRDGRVLPTYDWTPEEIKPTQ